MCYLTVKDITKEWDTLPPVPTTRIVYVRLGVLAAVVTTRLDPWVPPSAKVTVAGFRVNVGPLDTTGETAAVSVTVPVKPVRLVTRMVENPEEPAFIVRAKGVAVMVKSGGGGGVTVTKTMTA